MPDGRHRGGRRRTLIPRLVATVVPVMLRRGLDLEHYNELPRVETLLLSPDGRRLVATGAVLSGDGRRFVPALWELDGAGAAEPRRLTRSRKGESSPAFLPDGSLLFASARPDPEPVDDDDEEDDEPPALWLLPRAAAGAALTRPPTGEGS